jgi:hypothetical protein
MKETDRIIKETDLIIKENALQMKETDRQMKETDRMIKNLSVENEKTALQMKETDLKLDRLSKQIGGIDDNIGHHAEEFFQNIFKEKMVFGGVKYNKMIPNMHHKDDSGEVEIDIVLKNGNSVALIEVKNRIHPKFVREFAEDRVKKFRVHFPRYSRYKAYLGIAGFSFSKPVQEEAKKYGIGIIRQVGKGIEIKAGRLKKY